MHTTPQLESAIWSIADGRASEADLAALHADEHASLVVLERLIVDAEDDVESVRRVRGEEREQILADFTDTLRRLLETAALLLPEVPDSVVLAPPSPPFATPIDFDDLAFEELAPMPVALQATWHNGQIVVWAGGRGSAPENHDDLANRIEKVGGPPHGWEVHKGVPLPDGQKADALAISMKDALGWLVAVGGGQVGDGVGASVGWLGHVALEGVRLVVRGSVVPSVKIIKRPDSGPVEAAVRWIPALTDSPEVDALAPAMPATITALGGGDGRAIATAVVAAVVETIVGESVERMELPAAPPNANTPTDLNDTIIARMNGSIFRANANLATDTARRLEQWSRGVTATNRKKLVVELDPPGEGGVWVVSVKVPTGKGRMIPVDVALRTEGSGHTLQAEWIRLGRLFPALDRAGIRRRGQVALSQDEAWDFMTILGPTLSAAGFDVRVPAMSRRKAKPTLRLFAETPAGSVVGAHQLANVAWTILFDDLELTAAEVQHLARQARPLVRANGKWVEVDRVDLEKAAAALADRATVTTMTGAEILRASIGLDGSGLSGGTVVQGNSWANDILQKAGSSSMQAVTRPDGFDGELRTYQGEALGWLGFLDAAELGGCLALDMGLGKTPTMLAHLARCRGNGAALVVAPAAVVGNWAAEAARFAPGLRVLVHHGADRWSDAALEAQVAKVDVVITTYATAVRDVDVLARVTWGRVVLDEAQAIKNPTSDTSQQLRRIPARSRIALTGTPIENGLGDLWAILDFTNPGLVGSRPSFIAQMSGDGEAALRALNGILLFRRTKAEPEVAAELPDKIDELDHCTMTPEQIGLYQAVLDSLLADVDDPDGTEAKQGAILAAITALKQICNHPAAYRDDGLPLGGRSGKLLRLQEICESVFAANERVLIFTHFATWGRRLAVHLTELFGRRVECYDGSLARGARDQMIEDFQKLQGPGAMVLSLKAGGTGLNLTNANHVVLYDRWWNPAVEDQARDRAWRIGQSKMVISHRLVCPGTVDERVEEVVAGKRHIANLVLPKSSSLADLSPSQLRIALGLRPEELLAGDDDA
jgi:superfamily II DNA or RNA helicase